HALRCGTTGTGPDLVAGPAPVRGRGHRFRVPTGTAPLPRAGPDRGQPPCPGPGIARAAAAPLEPDAELDQVPEGTPRNGYSVTVPLEGGEEISLRVGRSSRPTALARLSWIDGAADYHLVHLPADEEEDALEAPDAETSQRWSQVYRRIGLI